MTDQVRVSYAGLTATIKQALAAQGMPEQVRDVVAEVMAEADLLGVPSHGVRTLPLLLSGLRDGRANPNPDLKLLRDGLATCLLDGDHGPGHYVSVQAMRIAIEKAGRFGVGICVATRLTHWGRGHAYAYRASQAGMIGLCTTNAVPNMLGFGSHQPVLGNNPLAISVPRGPGRDPVVLDMAMSQAALGKIGTYLREGKPVPPGWGLDASGRPSTDPAAILSSGLILPMGEYKGAGLALMMEVLTGALSGGLLSHEVARANPSFLDAESSKFMMAIDPAAFLDMDVFVQRVDDLLAYIAMGVDPGAEFLYPGLRGWQARDRFMAEGIPIHPQIVNELAGYGITLPAL